MPKTQIPLNAKGKPLDEDGRELLDPTPMAPPLGYKPQPSMFEMVRDMVRREMSEAAREQGLETFEEADDFDVGDDFDPRTPYEEHFDPVDAGELIRRHQAEIERLRAEAANSGGVGGGAPDGRAAQPPAAGGAAAPSPGPATAPAGSGGPSAG